MRRQGIVLRNHANTYLNLLQMRSFCGGPNVDFPQAATAYDDPLSPRFARFLVRDAPPIAGDLAGP